jgi:hypothetical protein
MALKIDALEGPPTHEPPEHRTLLPGIRVLGLAPQQLRKPGDVSRDPPRLVSGQAIHFAVGAGAGTVDSLFSTVMGNHLAVVVPLSSVVRTRIHEFPVHLSSRIEPRLPPAVAFVMTTVKHAPC